MKLCFVKAVFDISPIVALSIFQDRNYTSIPTVGHRDPQKRGRRRYGPPRTDRARAVGRTLSLARQSELDPMASWTSVLRHAVTPGPFAGRHREATLRLLFHRRSNAVVANAV
jgi:hypothetical protein